jgi:predicted RNase H-like nuclease
MTYFVGIDLAWRTTRNPTGAAVLNGDEYGAILHSISAPLRSESDILAFVSDFSPEDTVVAIDGPLVITNTAGIRSCERSVSTRYGSRHASCHSSNLNLYPDAFSVRLARHLISRGFRHPDNELNRHGTVLEVYPHAGFVALFDLPEIIRYKKGRVLQRAAGLRSVQAILRGLGMEDPPLNPTPDLDEFLSVDPALIRGAARKDYEDSLDALFCAFLAFYFWRWGLDRSELFGDLKDGYILNPKLREHFNRPSAA